MIIARIILLGGLVKKFISRPDAAEKYRIGRQTIIDWHRKGLLTAYIAEAVGYSQATNRPGPRVKYVYDESQIEILAEKVIRDAKTVKHGRLEAEVFDLLDHGIDLIKIVKQLKLLPTTAEQLRAFYMREKGGVFIPAHVVQELLEMNLRLTAENAADILMALIERLRAAEARCGKVDKPPPTGVHLIPNTKKKKKR